MAIDKNSWGWKRTQSVLPLVFDDSMSYYEAVARLVSTVNQLITLINGGVDENLKEYIDERFADFTINAIYDEKTETIIFSKGSR